MIQSSRVFHWVALGFQTEIPIGPGIRRHDFHVETDIGEVGLDDLGRGHLLGLRVEGDQRQIEIGDAGLLQQILRLVGLVGEFGGVAMAEDAEGNDAMGRRRSSRHRPLR